MSEVKSKTILELEPISSVDAVDIREVGIPSQMGDKNFLVFIQDIVNYVTKSSIGLDRVDNTPDAEKPLSNAIIEALLGKANSTHTHNLSDIDQLNEVLQTYLSRNEQISIDQLQEVVRLIEEKADDIHRHKVEDVEGLRNILDQKAESDHKHSLNSLTDFEEFYSSLMDVINNKIDIQVLTQRLNEFKQDLTSSLSQDFVRELPGKW